MKMSLNSILEDLEKYVEHKMEQGESVAGVKPETVRQLGVRHEQASGDVVSSSDDALKQIAGTIGDCTLCDLHRTRHNVVPGQGCQSPEIMFVGEAPGADEDEQGLAFIGRAGKLLTKMIGAMGFSRDEVFIGNILKCRPPGNRTPTPQEMEVCMPYLKAQIAVLQPKVIVALGGTAAKGLLNTESGISKLRGIWTTFEDIDLMPTYHPAYLLYNPSAKRDVWEDLQAVLKKLGRKVPPVKA